MSLRRRLVLLVVGLLALGLTGAMGATFGALRDWRSDQDDQLLTSLGRQLAAEVRDGAIPPGAGLGARAGVFERAAERGDIPSFFQLRTADGRVRQTIGFGPVPRLPEVLGERSWPRDPSAANPDGERFFTAPTVDGGGTATPNWLLRSARTGPNGDILLVGLQTARSDELVSRTRNVAIISIAVALVAVTVLSLRVVRRGLRPLDEIADTAGAIGAGDLTRRVDAAGDGTEVGRLGDALNAMLGQLETAFRSREQSEDRLRRFVADASHELRTPVATVRGYAELFRRGAADDPDELAKVMRRIESEADRMGVLVDELLLLARLDQGRPLARDPVELTRLARDAVMDARAADPSRVLALDLDGPVTVRGDADRLRQVFGNLLANVVQHTPPEAAAVVRVRYDGADAVIEVRDDGPGLTAAQRERAFERFYRGDHGHARDQRGAGLGLSIVAAVVAAHGGSVGVRSEPGDGAAFEIVIPREGAPAG